MGNSVRVGTKFFDPRVYTDSEKAFIKKYGEGALYYWERMTDQQKADYEKLEKYCSNFATLFTENYEDLKLYAIMYRNVPLYNIRLDVYSMLFFGSRIQQIIGYKNKLLSEKNHSRLSQSALLYYENEALFPKFCIKYANVNFQQNRKGNKFFKELSLNSIKDLRDGNIPHVFSVNDLTTAQCDMIIANKGKIPAEYSDLCDKYLGEWPTVKLFNKNLNEEDFVRKYFVPLIIEKKSKEYKLATYILEFVKNKIQQMSNVGVYTITEEIKNLTNSERAIQQEREKIQKLSKEKEEKMKEAEKLPASTQEDEIIENLEKRRSKLYGEIGIYSMHKTNVEKAKAVLNTQQTGNNIWRPENMYMFEYHERLKWVRKQFEESEKFLKDNAKSYETAIVAVRELDGKIRDHKRNRDAIREDMGRKKADEIASLEREIENKQEKVDENYSMLIRAATQTNVFRIIYNYREEVEEYVGKSYELLYNKEWLKDPVGMRERESKNIGGS